MILLIFLLACVPKEKLVSDFCDLHTSFDEQAKDLNEHDYDAWFWLERKITEKEQDRKPLTSEEKLFKALVTNVGINEKKRELKKCPNS